MTISMPSAVTVLGILLISNCILSFGQSTIMKKCYIILSSIFTIIGIYGMVIIRSLFISRFNKNAIVRHFDTNFVTWAINKFDTYAIYSILLTCLVIVFLLLLLFFTRKNKQGFVWTYMSAIVICFMIINLYAGFWYGLGTINKEFDIAFYIVQLTFSEIFVLYIPLIIKRIIAFKE